MVIRGRVKQRDFCVICIVRFALTDAKRIFFSFLFFSVLVEVHWERN